MNSFRAFLPNVTHAKELLLVAGLNAVMHQERVMNFKCDNLSFLIIVTICSTLFR